MPSLDASREIKTDLKKSWQSKMLHYSPSLERSAQQLAVPKHHSGLEISLLVHSICHKGQKTARGNKDPYEIAATEAMCKYWNCKNFWWMRAKRVDVWYWKGCSPRSGGFLLVVFVRGF